MTTQLFAVPTMHCASCVMLLEGLEDEVPGIKRVQANYKKQQAVVEYEETQVTLEEIIHAIEKEGYKPLIIQ